MIGKIVLGTAAFAIREYRLSGQPMPTRGQALDMLDGAWNAGIRHFDTAQAYGDGLAESILGESGIPKRPGAIIITKIRPGTAAIDIPAAFAESTARLGAEPSVLLLHAERDQHDGAICEQLLSLSYDSHALRVGVSVYDPAEADFALGWADWLQYPANPLDRAIRPASDTTIKQVRSVFLRGRLLRTLSVETCLRYANEATGCDLITVGVGDLRQLKQVIEIATRPAWWQDLDAANKDRPREVMGSVCRAQA